MLRKLLYSCNHLPAAAGGLLVSISHVAFLRYAADVRYMPVLPVHYHSLTPVAAIAALSARPASYSASVGTRVFSKNAIHSQHSFVPLDANTKYLLSGGPVALHLLPLVAVFALFPGTCSPHSCQSNERVIMLQRHSAMEACFHPGAVCIGFLGKISVWASPVLFAQVSGSVVEVA